MLMFENHFDTQIQDGHHLVEWKANFSMRAFIIIWLNTLVWFIWIPAHGALFHNLYFMLRFVQIWRFSVLVSKLLRQGYSSHKLQTTFGKFYGRHTDFVHNVCWRVCITTVTYEWFPVNIVNRDWCRMWSRKCSLFPEHLIHLGGAWYHPFIICMTEFVSLGTMFTD